MDCRLILVNIMVGVRARLFHMDVQWTIIVYCKDHLLPTELENSPIINQVTVYVRVCSGCFSVPLFHFSLFWHVGS